MNENNNEEIKKEDELFDENGRMKIDPNQKGGPTLKAKRITLIVSIIAITLILFLAFKFSNNEPIIDNTTIEKENEISTSENDNTSFTEIAKKFRDEETRYISKDGFLFDTQLNEYVISDSKEIMYIYSADVLKNDNPKNVLSMYLITKNNDTFILMNENNEIIELTTNEYNDLINLYTVTEEIVYPNSTDPDFYELSYMALAKMNEDENINVDFVNTRYLAINGNYGVIICSPKGMDDDLHGYIFEKQNNVFEMIISDYQNINNYLNFVNNNYGYMDIDLLLNMDINKYPKEDFYTDLSPVVNGMMSANMISTDDYLTYGVGIDNLMYMELASGLAFVGVIEDSGIVTSYPVVNTFETKVVLEKFNNDPPYIILKQY